MNKEKNNESTIKKTPKNSQEEDKEAIIKEITNSEDYKKLKCSSALKRVYLSDFSPGVLNYLKVEDLKERAKSLQKMSSFNSQLVKCIHSGNGFELKSSDYPNFGSQSSIQKTLKKITLAHKIISFSNIREEDSLEIFSNKTIKTARECFNSLPLSVTTKETITENDISENIGNNLYCVSVEEFEAIHKEFLDYSRFIGNEIEEANERRTNKKLLTLTFALLCLGVPFCLNQFNLISFKMMIVIFIIIMISALFAIFEEKIISLKNTENTGEYLSLIDRAKIFEDVNKSTIIRKYARVLVMLAICLAGSLFGIYQKQYTSSKMITQYKEDPYSNNLSLAQLEDKEIYNIFVDTNLGNDPYQSLFGGYFYSREDLMIYPDDFGSKTMIEYMENESVLSENLVDNINVRNKTILYRNPVNHDVYEYDLSTSKTIPLEIKNVGQFIICDDICYYIDLGNKSALVSYNMTENKKKTLIETSVKKFIIAGNELIFLNEENKLYSYNIDKGKSKLLEKNVASFTYNGTLWIQNSDRIFRQMGNNFTEVSINDKCNRLLGMTDSFLIYDTPNGNIVHRITDNIEETIGTDIIIGASDNKVLCYDFNNDKYNSVYIDL